MIQTSIEQVFFTSGSPRAPLNPERGFMVETSAFASNFQPLTVAELEGYRTLHRVTMIRR